MDKPKYKFWVFWWNCLKWAFSRWEGGEAMSTLIFGAMTLILFIAGVGIASWLDNFLFLLLVIPFFIMILLIAPYSLWKNERERADNLEREKKPCLEIGEIKEQQGAIDSVVNTWVLEIKNIGIEAAEECHALLQQITTEFSSGKLNKFPARDFHWAGQAENMHHFKIQGQQSANLGLVYFGGDKENSITLCYRANRDYRLSYDLSMFNEPILLLLNIKSKDTLPLYAVIRIDLEEMVKNLLIQPKDKPICQILWHGTEKRDLSEFTVSGESGAEGNGDEL